MDKPEKTLILLTGPTASGKSSFALQIAEELDGEIINSDSVQIYKEIPIITSSPRQQTFPMHYLYNIISGQENSSVFKMLELIEKTVNFVLKKGKTPIIVGGTPMYNRMLVDGIFFIPDIPKQLVKDAACKLQKIGHTEFFNHASKMDPNITKFLQPQDTQRLVRAYSVFMATGMSLFSYKQRKFFLKDKRLIKICLQPQKSSLIEKSLARVESMIKNGAIEEVISLLSKGLDPTSTIMRAIGVSEISYFLENNQPMTSLIASIHHKTTKYIKHQNTWFNNKFLDFYKTKEPNIQEVLNILRPELT